MKKKTYKTLVGLLRAADAGQFTMNDFLSGQIYVAPYVGAWIETRATLQIFP